MRCMWLRRMEIRSTAAAPVKKFPLAAEPAYYFDPLWSPDSKFIAFHDNRLNIYLLDTTTGKLVTIGEKNVFGGFSNQNYDLAWSPDSKWIAYPQSMANHLHALYLYSVDDGQVDAGDQRGGGLERAGLRSRRQVSCISLPAPTRAPPRTGSI